GARVYLSGTPFFAMTGETGRFRMDSIPAGQYSVAFEHPYVSTLPLLPEPVSVQADSLDLQDVQLSVPSTFRIIDALCPAAERQRFTAASRDTTSTNRGVIFGAVRPGAELIRDLEVGLTWRRFSLFPNSMGGMRATPHSLGVSIEADGRYTICSVPIEHPMTIDLSLRRRVVQRDSMRLLPPGLMRRDFALPERR
ncbi:MAG: carboxypeptidase-like regulatory domain-containing protein, partial [Longimicrobiales bacterium]